MRSSLTGKVAYIASGGSGNGEAGSLSWANDEASCITVSYYAA